MLSSLLAGASARPARRCGLLTLLLAGAAAAASAQTTIYGLGIATYDVVNPFTGVQLYPAGTPLLIPISPTTGAPTDPTTGTAYGISYVPSNITGITAGQVLVGIDYRPNNGQLYGLGYNAATGATQLYTLAPGASGTATVATPVNTTPLTLNLGNANTGPSSKRIGFDFNPAADRIRVVSTNGRNYRLNPNTGGLAAQDTNLAYSAAVGTPVATPVAITTGTPVPTIPAAPGVGSVAYINATLGAGSTTLYDYDELSGGIISIQSPPDAGTLTAPTRSTFYITGSGQPGPYALAENDIAIDMDVYYDRSTRQNVAYLVEVTDDRPSGYNASNLYSLDLATGQASRIGNIIPSQANPLNPSAPLVPIDVYDIAAAITAPLIWSGFVSDEWTNAANWVPQRVPTSADDVFIPGTYTPGATLLAATFPGTTPTPNQPTVRVAGQAANSVALNTGATLTLVSGGVLNVSGDFSNTGGTVAGGGTGLVALVGSRVQSVGGSALSTFPNLSVGTATATTTGPVAIQSTGGLTLNGNLAIGSGQPFTLSSNASGTAYVVNNGSAEATGTATVQRYITPTLNAGPGYRHYSPPVSGSTVADFTTSGFAPTVNPAYNTDATPPLVTPFPTVYFYNQSRLGLSNSSPEFDKGFASPAALSDPLIPTSGYTVNIPGTELVDFVGTLNNGSISRVNLMRGAQATAGYQLLGNPYPGAINYDVVRTNSSGLESALYVFKSSGQYTGTYTSYVNGASANTGTNVLPVAQGFFVRVASGQTGTVNFTNAARLNAPDNTLFQRTAADPRPHLALTLRNATVANQTYIYFEQGATAGFDADFDAHYLPATHGLDLAADLGSAALSISGLPSLTGPTTTVPLHLHAAVAGPYTLAVDELANLPAGYHAYLRDALTGTYTDLATTPTISLTLAPADAATGRYAIVFGTAAPLAAAPAATAQLVSLYPNPAHGTVQLLLPQALRTGAATAVTVVDNLGRVVVRRTLGSTAPTLDLPLDNLRAGVYSVQAETNAGVVAKRLVVE
ncbi:MAG TPA: DUF4394 domain-containing protein [Hymenobacter sp.]|uniref:DUF4394 domain-containing protein n=1 Tax=Hymenobacter sp. TaxID=1898978 RepID=UPI002D8071AA|nr:DUF4394 domain-containing protein [Hymenobacter sp.]HET9505265.1 DUF4394 domain-containing protein [Hymenobacter sp.]